MVRKIVMYLFVYRIIKTNQLRTIFQYIPILREILDMLLLIFLFIILTYKGTGSSAVCTKGFHN